MFIEDSQRLQSEIDKFKPKQAALEDAKSELRTSNDEIAKLNQKAAHSEKALQSKKEAISALEDQICKLESESKESFQKTKHL